MNRRRLPLYGVFLLAFLALAACARAASPSTSTPSVTITPTPMTGVPSVGPQGGAPEYYAPLANAQYVSKGTTVIVRYGPTISSQDLTNFQISVTGSESGVHQGQTILADDKKTIIFKPDQGFTPGENVQVNIGSFHPDPGGDFGSLTYSFTVATSQSDGAPGSSSGTPAPNTTSPRSAFPNFLTVPQDIPHFTVNAASANNGEGDIFVAPFYWTKSGTGSYLLILNGQGQLVYYKSVADQWAAMDFTAWPNGLLSYFDQKDSEWVLMNSHYQVVDTYKAGNGYIGDLHDFQILPNGDVLLEVADQEQVDMSKVVPGGQKNAEVTGLVIQEMDSSHNVIWQWRSWDHIPYQESTADLTAQNIDLIHGNALALANDGNLLISARNLSAIAKINLQTGAVMWTLGGKDNQFKITGQTFAFQHDVRQLPNGDITVFDNQGTTDNPAVSHAIEYKIDEANKTATVVWEYTPNAPLFGTYMGNVQRLSDGNTFISWGAPYTGQGWAYDTMTEVSPDNKVLFDLAFDQPYVSYRAFRLPWTGSPDTPPDLASKIDGSDLTLGYSWNGATQVASWRLYAGSSSDSLQLMAQEPKTDFETQSHFTGLPAGQCYYQVAAVDANGQEMARSQVISTALGCPAAQ